MVEEIKQEDDFAKAERLNNDLKVQNDRAEKILKENQALESRRILGGRSEAGKVPEVKKEETPKEYKDRIMKNKK